MSGILALRSFGVLVSCLCFATVSLLAQQITADEVIAMVAEAMGGADRIEALKTLRFDVHHWRDGEESFTSIWEIKRPDLYRKQFSETLVFDGNRASTDGGVDGEPHLLSREHWMHFPWDIAFWFPAFFDYESEYLGQQTVDGLDGHVLRIVMPLGGIITYHIEADSHLPRTITIALVIDGVERDFLTEISDYRNVDGILFPHTNSRKGEQIAVLHNVEFNVSFPDDHFEISIGNN